jgi:hypothetical protein
MQPLLFLLTNLFESDIARSTIATISHCAIHHKNLPEGNPRLKHADEARQVCDSAIQPVLQLKM